MSTMFTRILVPLDGSPRAEQALPLAARLARSAGGTVILTSVVSPMPVFGAPLEIPRGMQSYIEDELAGAKDYLTRVSQACLAGVKTEMVTSIGKPVATELIELAPAQHADMIVMCSHGRTGIARWALGSVAQRIIRSAPVPVLVLKAGGPTLAHASADEPVRVLVPLDGSPLAETAIEPATQLAAALAAPGQAVVHLLHVIEYPVVAYPAFTPAAIPPTGATGHHQLQEKARAYLHLAAQRFAQEPLSALHAQALQSVVFDEDAASAIAAAADRTAEGAHVGVDFIAMATHGRTGLARMTMGSVTERVLQATQRPLFVIRPEPDAAQGEPALKQTRQPLANQVAMAPMF